MSLVELLSIEKNWLRDPSNIDMAKLLAEIKRLRTGVEELLNIYGISNEEIELPEKVIAKLRSLLE